MKEIGIIIMCLLLYACNPVASTNVVDGDNHGKQTEVRKTNTKISEYTVTEFAKHRIWIIDYCGHEYMCVGTGGIVHLESCRCNKL
jgi:hypothetical protein